MGLDEIGRVLSMAWKDFRHEDLISFCNVLGLAATLCPLLVVFGIKHGIVSTMIDRLVEDPRNREVVSTVLGRFDRAWFADINRREDVVFVIPRTRSLAATVDLFSAEGKGDKMSVAEMVPTGAGDPLLARWSPIPRDRGEGVLSAQAARRINAKPGETVRGRVRRMHKGKPEDAGFELKVLSVLPEGAYPREGVFVNLDLLLATEGYRDGEDWRQEVMPEGEIPEGRTFPSFRLYARSIDDVAGLVDYFYTFGIEVYTQAAEIETVRTFDRNFTVIFWIIAGVTAFGYFFSMASNALANVMRKGRDLGMMSLVGFRSASVVWFPLAQAVMTGVLGVWLAAGCYKGAEWLINTLFKAHLASNERICFLEWHHFFTATGLTVALVGISTIFAGVRLLRLDPAEAIRDV